MDAIWFWFIRPFAEFLGHIFLFAILVGAGYLMIKFMDWKNARAYRKRMKDKQQERDARKLDENT